MVKLLLVKKRTKTGNESMYLVDKKFVINKIRVDPSYFIHASQIDWNNS